MPVMNGFRAAQEIRLIAPYTKIIFFSMHKTPSGARLVGANAFDAKHAGDIDDADALRGLTRRVAGEGEPVRATVEGMTGARFVHDQLELAGWDEEKITLRFWIVGILAGLLGVTLFLASIQALA